MYVPKRTSIQLDTVLTVVGKTIVCDRYDILLYGLSSYRPQQSTNTKKG